MVMIRCPNCGQRTLDVASVCPKCGHVLLQNPLETSPWSGLVSCRRCGKHIDKNAAVCPFCGHNAHRARRLTALAWVSFIVVALGAAGYSAYRAGYLDRLLPGRGPAATAAPDTVVVALDTTPPTTTPIVAEPPDTVQRRLDTTIDRSALEPAEEGPAPERLRTRWTNDWANVREDRSTESPVVRVLAPGRQVDVAGLQGGWWEYYEEGARLGYIANSVLASQPPNLSPDGTGASSLPLVP